MKVYAEATLVFPLLVAKTFAAQFHEEKAKKAAQEAAAGSAE